MNGDDDPMSVDLTCPGCGYDVRVQVVEGIARCPECGGRLLHVADYPNPVEVWRAVREQSKAPRWSWLRIAGIVAVILFVGLLLLFSVLTVVSYGR